MLTDHDDDDHGDDGDDDDAPDPARLERAFEALVPAELRHLSHLHWTPAEIAVRVARLLAPARDTRILDVGAGLGKLCALGALASRAGTWCGVEHDRALVTAASGLARELGVADRTSFAHGDALACDWGAYDALYFYNPFEQPLFDRAARADLIAAVQARLAALRADTRVVTFNGFGGVMPASFALESYEHVPGVGLDLALWRQRDPASPAATGARR